MATPVQCRQMLEVLKALGPGMNDEEFTEFMLSMDKVTTRLLGESEGND